MTLVLASGVLGTQDYDHDIDGFEAFTFDFKFQWPMTLIFTVKVSSYADLVLS